MVSEYHGLIGFLPTIPLKEFVSRIGVLLGVLFMGCTNSQYKLSSLKNGNTYAIAHKGVHHCDPENFLDAYEKAIELGCDFVELDLRKTKYDRFVSGHNKTIDAYFEGRPGKVK